MTKLVPYVGVAVGVALSFMLPLLLIQVKNLFPDHRDDDVSLRASAKKLLVLSLFSLATSVVVVAMMQTGAGANLNFNHFLLAGYTWDSTIQKWVTARGASPPGSR